MATYVVFSVEYNNQMLKSVLVSAEALADAPPEDFFTPGWDNWKKDGTITVEGPGELMMEDYYTSG